MTMTLQTLQGRYNTRTLQTFQGRYRHYKDVTQTLQGHYCQTLPKCGDILTTYDPNEQIHVEQMQERHFFKIKNLIFNVI